MHKYFVIFLVATLGLFTVPLATFAFSTTEHVVSAPYEPFALAGNIAAAKILLGDLAGEPQMYEFAVGEETAVSFMLTQRARAEPVPLSLILVKVGEENRGVEEIGRLRTEVGGWEEYTDSALGINLIRGEALSAVLQPGLYRVEVSAATNQGKYALISGTRASEGGYFAKIGEIRTVQRFFEASIFSILLTPFVYIPLGFILVIMAFSLTWLYRRSLAQNA